MCAHARAHAYTYARATHKYARTPKRICTGTRTRKRTRYTMNTTNILFMRRILNCVNTNFQLPIQIFIIIIYLLLYNICMVIETH